MAASSMVAVVSVRWFYIIVEIKLGLQYEPEKQSLFSKTGYP